MQSSGSVGLALFAAALTLSPARDHPRGTDPHRATGCEALGPGYHRLDGSDTCLKIGGAVRIEGGFTVRGGRGDR